MMPEIRKGPLAEIERIHEQESLEAGVRGKPHVAIMRDNMDGTYTEVFNSYRGVDIASLPEIEYAISLEEKYGDKNGNPEMKERRLNILRDARIKKLSEAEKAMMEREKEKGQEAAEPSAGELMAPQALSLVVTEIMRPVLESLGGMMKRMSEAVEHIATSQDVMRNRLEALEKQVRLQTPVTVKQARYLADAARRRAKELLGPENEGAVKAVGKLAGAIKKAVVIKYGYDGLQDVPRCEYEAILRQIETWNKPMEVFEIMEKARAELEAKAEKGQAETEAKGG